MLFAQALEELPPQYRDVIVLHSMEGLTHEEVAERLGKTPGAVRMLWIRALAQLKKVLERRPC